MQGLHPRLVAEGFDLAKKRALEVLDDVMISGGTDRDTLINVARTSLRTKLHEDLADAVTEVCTLYMQPHCCATFYEQAISIA